MDATTASVLIALFSLIGSVVAAIYTYKGKKLSASAEEKSEAAVEVSNAAINRALETEQSVKEFLR